MAIYDGARKDSSQVAAGVGGAEENYQYHMSQKTGGAVLPD